MSEEIMRHQITKNMREYLFQKGYIEVVSSIIRDCDSKINPRFKLINGKFIRDCMELSLRKKISRACPKIFEIGPCFRQDKEDNTHRTEFYMMELYSKDESLKDMIELMSGIITACMPSVDDVEEVSIREFILGDLNIDIAEVGTSELIASITQKCPIVFMKDKAPHLTVNRYIKLYVESTLLRKGCLYFLIDYPLCTIAVASRKNKTNCIQRFECYINGLEVSNAFEDCMDADDLEVRLKQSNIMAEEEKELLDLVKTGSIPPTVGLGIGIDRLCMLTVQR